MAFIVAGIGAYALSRFADQAFADSFGLRTIRVGTDPLTWVSSHFIGLSRYSCRVSNMTDEYGVDFVKLFGMINEKLTQTIERLSPGWFQTIASTAQRWVLHNYIVTVINDAVKSTSPWVHGFFFKSTPLMWIFRKCTMHTVSYLEKTAKTYDIIMRHQHSGNLHIAVGLSFSLIAALFTPTLKFRHREAEAQTRFTEWTNTGFTAGNVLLIPKEDLFPTNIGIFGTLKNIGLPPWSKVTKVALGVTKLVLAGAVAYGTFKLCPHYIVSHKTALIAGAVLAVI